MFVVVNNYRDGSAVNLRRIQRVLEANGQPYTTVRTPEECRALVGQRVIGVILSGGNTDPAAAEPAHRTALISIMFLRVPKLYICFAMEVVLANFGAPIRRMDHRESGLVDPGLFDGVDHWLFRGGKPGQRFRVNHSGYIHESEMGPSFRPLALDTRGIVYACDSERYRMYCVQFHPEAEEDTTYVLRNFIQRCVRA